MRKVLAVLSLLVAPSAAAGDACHALLPGVLISQVTERFPSFRLPAVTDNLAEDVAWSKEQSGNECLGAASADFDGDGTKDWLLGLTAKAGTGSSVIVALTRGDSWQLHKLAEWPEGRSRLYVGAEKPGTYDSLFDGPYEPGEVSSFVCPHSVVVFGAAESSGVAYCYKAGKWQHTWISD
ncbi:hypothetical protein [Xanthomonas sp. 3058]|uniref:hypothetical protein n=1 Tax=Xanthomonas sp. 3058 TaxID=3035314 RepID=UPI00160FC3B5|nr:hypothetical protein [Xanthomonas sp. 3058]MBB5863531.1 hypothetical protein [Xanthomonas sp. 3058]